MGESKEGRGKKRMVTKKRGKGMGTDPENI